MTDTPPESSDADDEGTDEEEPSPIIFQVTPGRVGVIRNPVISEIVGEGVFGVVPAATVSGMVFVAEEDDTAEATGVFFKPRGDSGVLVPHPILDRRVKHQSFFIDFYHSGDPDEMYEVHVTFSDRVRNTWEWHEVEDDLADLVIALARRVLGQMGDEAT